MKSTFLLLRVDKACDDAILWVTHKLEESGYQAVQTFDLQVARQLQTNYLCPYHGVEKCNCQIAVLLIYKGKQKPITIIVHGRDQASWFYLANTPQQPVEYRLERMIQNVLTW